MRRHSRNIRVWPVCALIGCILTAFLWSSAQIGSSIRDVNSKYEQSRVKYNQLQNEQEKLKDTLELVDTEAFIENQARTLYGYMRPDEIRFVITNPEVLYGTDELPER
jgi:cell division protein FtsB